MRCTHFHLRWSIEDFSHASTNSHFQENVLSHLITQKSFSKQIIVFRNSSPIFLFHFFFVFLFFCFVLFFLIFFFLCFCFVLFSGFCLFFVCLCVCIFLLTHYYSAPIMLLRGIFVKRIQPVSVSVQAQLKPNFLQAPLSDEASNSVYQWQQMRHHPLVKIYSKSICDQFQSHRAT